MAAKTKSTRVTNKRARTAPKMAAPPHSSLREAEALEHFKRLMTKYRGKCSFAGVDE